MKTTLRKLIAVSVLSLAFFLVPFSQSNAADQAAPSVPNAAAGMGALMPNAQNNNAVKKAVEPVYEQVTYEGLYRLAWAHGAYQIDDNDAIDAFLMISECKLFEKFYSDEFEWENIRAATKKYLKNIKPSVPRYYEYVQPILLQRYDTSLQGFPLEKAKDYVALRRFQFAQFSSGSTGCNKYRMDSSKYPSTATLNVFSPFTLTFIRVPKELAREYVKWNAGRKTDSADGRQAVIRYRFRIDKYTDISGFMNGAAFNFEGKLLRIDVFADKELTMPLYNQVF